jgi:hypothetical protein
MTNDVRRTRVRLKPDATNAWSVVASGFSRTREGYCVVFVVAVANVLLPFSVMAVFTGTANGYGTTTTNTT